MQLTVPQRTIADTGSFPVDPTGVTPWLAELHPLDSESDAREIYRGLKHSNRLHNDVDRRRRVISCFIPVLRELHAHLSELSNAQPLPLTREFARNARLRDSLLREEAFAFKILLCDSPKPLADDARRAMQALARQAESVIHAYRTLPDALIEDAHQLYALAEEHNLLSEQHGSDLLSLQDHYRFILLLSLGDLSQQRARQLPLVLDFLRKAAVHIHLERKESNDTVTNTDFAVDLRQGSRPEPVSSLLNPNQNDVRWFSITPVLHRINSLSSTIKTQSTSVLVSDTLERQSLVRLYTALARSRHRRMARRIAPVARRVVLGHKEICAHLLYRPTQSPTDNEPGWVVTNETQHGMCLHSPSCRAGMAQVGELVSVTEPDITLVSKADPRNTKIDALMGVVRWIKAQGDVGIIIGVEFLARSVIPVHVTRDENKVADDFSDQTDDRDDVTVGENALIIACKVRNKVVQTMLLPSYLYQTNDRLIAAQGNKSRHMQLEQCLQSNGLFSQYSLMDKLKS